MNETDPQAPEERTGQRAEARASVAGSLPDGDIGAAPDRGSANSAPRSITALAIVIGILAVLTFVVLHLVGAVGPGGH